MARFVNVAAFAELPKAEIARSVLADAGIESLLADNEAVVEAWLPADSTGVVALRVAEHEADRAAAVLAEAGLDAHLVGDRISDEELERQAMAEEAEGE